MLEYVSQGMTEDEAAKRAVLQMGNPIKIGQDLHKTHRPKTEWSLVGLVAIMVLIGAGALFSLASDSAANMFPGFFARHLVNAFIGIAVALGCYFMNYTKLEKYSLHIFLVTLVVLYLSQIFSVRVDGTHYVVIGPFSFMAGLMTLPFLLISFSGLLNRWFFNSLKDRVIVFGLAFLAVIMSLLQGSLVTTMLLITGLLVLITMAIIDKKFPGPKQAYLVAIYGGVMAVLTLFLLSQPYRTRRLLSFLNPTSDPTGEGYLSMTLRNILAGAKLWGSGEGLYINHTGTLYSFALPEMNTEFILAYIISAFGWLAGIVVTRV